MPALHELQARFTAAMFDGAEEPLLACLAGPGGAARHGIAAYRRSIHGILIAALAATYPVVARIVGEPFFREAARRYIADHPSGSGDLNEYGGDFAGFLAAYPHARELPYLPDVARLEWAVQTVYYAPDAPPADLSALAACAPDDYGRLRFLLGPAWARLDAPWPLDEVWRVHEPGYAGTMTVDFSRPARVLVLRRAGRVRVEGLSAGEAALIDALAAGCELSAALGQALAAEAGFEPAPALARFAAARLLLRATL